MPIQEIIKEEPTILPAIIVRPKVKSRVSRTRSTASAVTTVVSEPKSNEIASTASTPKVPKLRIKLKEAMKKGNEKYHEKRRQLELQSSLPEPVKKVKLTKSSLSSLTIKTVPSSTTANFEPEIVIKELKSELEPTASEFGESQNDKSNSLKRKVSSVGYTLTPEDGSAAFSCLLCRRHFKSSLRELLNHLSESHRTSRWFGNCFSCGSQFEQGNIFDELMHLVTAHVLKERNDIKNVLILAKTSFSQRNLKNFMKDLRDRAKFQLKQQRNPPMVSIPKSDSPKFTNKKTQMCPWIQEGSDLRIKDGLVGYYLSKAYLMARFKCMNLECGFSSNSENVFKSHLENHKFQTSFTTHLCCYCSFSSVDTEKLIAHHLIKHSLDKYQCHSCMYRSCGDHIKRHVEKYHKDLVWANSKKLEILELTQIKSDKPLVNDSAENSWKLKAVNVPMMTCMSEIHI